MKGTLGIVIAPLIALLIAHRQRKTWSAFHLAEYLGDMAVLFTLTMLTMVPIDRAAVRLDYSNMRPYVDYGAVALGVTCFLGAALGIAARWMKRRFTLNTVMELRKPDSLKSRMARISVHAAIVILSVLTCCYLWALSNYGNITFEEIIFHLNMPLEGTSSSFVRDILLHAVLPGLVAAGLLFVLMYAPAKHCWRVSVQQNRHLWACIFPLKLSLPLAICGLAAWLSVLLVCADQNFAFIDFIRNQFRQSYLIEQEYVDASSIKLTFPEKKRNLITVYLESAETSSQDRENGGFFDVNYIPEMTRMARENVSFSQSERLEGAVIAPACGWTIAGLVAETAGLPLKLFEYNDQMIDNQMNLFASFMPGATMLGDILKNEGYRRVFLAGSNFTFGGRRLMYTQHGDYEIRDLPYAQEHHLVPPDEPVAAWGFQDKVLYAIARDTVTELAASDQAFHFAMLTVDTHAPDGDLCALCPDQYDEKIANVIACSSAQIGDFVRWCQDQPFYENTTIVIVGDHASMVAGFYGETEYEKHMGEVQRKVYNVFINSVAETKWEENRLFTTMDFFPTTLASIGVKIEGERLGLGTNLFSGKKTLAEIYGYETLFEELNRKSVFYNENILFP